LPATTRTTTGVLAETPPEPQQPSSSSSRSRFFTFRLPGRPMERDDEDNNSNSSRRSPILVMMGRGREFDLFDNRKSSISSSSTTTTIPSTTQTTVASTRDVESGNDSSASAAAEASTTGRRRRRESVIEEEKKKDDDDMTLPSTSSPQEFPGDSSHIDSSDYARITAATMVSSTDSIVSQPPRTPSLAGGGSGSGTSIGLTRFSGIKAEQGSQSKSNTPRSSIFQPVSTWWTSHISPNMQNWPKIKCRMEPTTTLKLRKTFRPLKTIVRLGADFNTQLGVWQFKSSWEDAIIGGKITLAGTELQISKSWQLSVGGGGGKMMGIGGTSNNNNLDDLITRLRFRAAVDLQTWKAYARVGFRTERLSPINVMEGFTLFQQIPLDGAAGHVKLEIKANFALPEPEIEYSTENKGGFIGTGTAHMGDIEINIDEFNLLLDY
jgi:hypothetical protein